jgi:polyisoprenoid-binding protein YceI
LNFFSKAPIENIEAVNNGVSSFLDAQKGELVFTVLIKSFKFQKALMEEHFNENFMQSNLYPKSNFKGAITDLNKVNFGRDGVYGVSVKGDLSIHGVTKTVEFPGIIAISQGKISASSKFKLALKDYNIKIPSTVINNIAETIEVSVECKYEPFRKG